MTHGKTKSLGRLTTPTLLAATLLLPLALSYSNLRVDRVVKEGHASREEDYIKRLTQRDKVVFNQLVSALGLTPNQRQTTLAFKFGDATLDEDRSFFGRPKAFIAFLEKTVGGIDQEGMMSRLLEWLDQNQDNPHPEPLTTTEVVS